MDQTLIISLIAGIILVLLVFAARITLRWVVRLVIVGFILLLVLGGAIWWWLKHSSPQPENRPRQTSGRRASSDGR